MRKLVDVEVPKPKGVEEVTAPEEKKKSVGERIAAAREDAIVLEATEKAHGLGTGSGAGPQESLAVQIVTNSMKQQENAVKDMKDNEKELQNEIKEANAAVGTMQATMMQDLLTRIEKAQTKLDESAKVAQGTGAPISAFDGYKQVKGELSTLVAELVKDRPAAEAQHGQGMSDATQIKLKELEMEQTRALSQITADNTRAQNEFNLKLAEFQDTKEIRRMEYADKKNFRTEGLQGVTDIVAAIGAGIKTEGGPGNPGDTATEKQPSGGEEAEMGAYINSFKCSVCGVDVPVQEGKGTAMCPNPECNAGFTIKDKE
ncbi:hypothetical protein LCGC14_0607280 [marine sediment metagenome]|uniref:Uncharacterized protein n=1 Tax=marine sediment metagenome TaxID=412755 RepID=A0A0F9RST4_9ZZZZ